jgi:hypothetical protein
LPCDRESPPLLEPDRLAIAECPKGAGYCTGMAGKRHLDLSWSLPLLKD